MRDVSSALQGWVGDRVHDLLERHRVPGLSVGFCDQTGPLWSAGFGTTAPVDGRPVSTTTMFSLQSASKMYIATAVMCAVRDELVELDVPLTKYLPTFTIDSPWESEPQSSMTLRHLLSHRAGLVHEAPRGSNYDDSDLSFEDHCASISETTLLFPVGAGHGYSNLGIDLAALVLQRVSGSDIECYLQQVLLGPLGLDRTTFDHRRIRADADRAVGHTRTGPAPLRVPMVGAGGGYASVDDALRYVSFHLGGGRELLSAGHLQQMYQVPVGPPGQQIGYGLGIDTGRWNERLVRNHGGGGFGFLCDVGWDPQAGVGVVVLTNTDTHPFQKHFATQLLDRVVDGSPAGTATHTTAAAP